MATPTVFEPKRLWAGLEIPAADTLVYTSPGGQLGTRLQGLMLVNTTAGPVTVRVTVGAMAAAQAVCWDFSVPADGLPYDLMEGQKTVVLNAGDVLRAQAATGASVTLQGFGVEMS